MNRTTLPPRRTPQAMPPAFGRFLRRWLRRWLRVVPGALLLGGLLAAGCGQDDQHVPEDFPSGARPAPIPHIELAASRTEMPPPPPAEPEVAPVPPAAQRP